MNPKNRMMFFAALLVALLLIRQWTLPPPVQPVPMDPSPRSSLVERGIEDAIDLQPKTVLPPAPDPGPIPELPDVFIQGDTDWEGWLRKAEPFDPVAREAWIAQGVALAKARRSQMAEWIEADPRRALEAAITPRQFAALPEELQVLVERPVAGEGFYGVLAICGHGAGEEHIEGECRLEHEVVFGFGTFAAEGYKASIYGARKHKLTVEEDALYGVILDNRIALHENEAVIVDDGEGAEGGRYALYFRNTVTYSDDRAFLEDLRESLLSEGGD